MKQRVYWIEGETEGSKCYFTGEDCGSRLLQYLCDNDPILCGAEMLNESTINVLDTLGPDDTIDQTEIV